MDFKQSKFGSENLRKYIPSCMTCNSLIPNPKRYKDLFFCNRACEKKYNQKIINQIKGVNSDETK